ncbi:MAG TPA: hypothetical protein VF679_03105, partial [Pedobacter sp.]
GSFTSGEKLSWRTLSRCLDDINKIQEVISRQRYHDLADPDLVLKDITALIHQQVPKRALDVPRMTRYAAIFGHKAVGSILENKIGLNIVECYFFTLHIYSSLQREPWVNGRQTYQDFGLTEDKTAKFFSWLSRTPAELRQVLAPFQEYGPNWAYTWNALMETPLISISCTSQWKMICPIPSLLWSRVGSGLFYDLVKDPAFANPYGSAFEAHIGKFSKNVLEIEKFQILEEQKYKVGKQVKDGIDWVVCDSDANMFIECKTKRLQQTSKLVEAGVSLQTDLKTLAKAIVQGYKNIIDALRGKTAWQINEKQSYLLVVTLEDWMLFPATIRVELDSIVAGLMNSERINPAIIEQIPFFHISCEEFERMVLVVRETGIRNFLEKKLDDKYRDWLMIDFIRECFGSEARANFKLGYSTAWQEVCTEMSKDWHPSLQTKLLDTFDISA